MIKGLLFLLIFNFCFMKDIFHNWSDEAKAVYYQTEKISPEEALKYQLRCPLPFCNLGYAYSDNWKRGLMWDGIRYATLYLSIYYDNKTDKCAYWDYSCSEKYDEERVFLNLTYLAMTIFKFVDVYERAENYNDNLYNRVFKSDRPIFSLNYSTHSNFPKIDFSFPLN